MQISSSTSSNTPQADLQKAQKTQETEVQRDQAQQTREDQNRVQEAAKITGIGQNLNITG